MSLRVMNQILDHVAQCYLYAIDTESEMSNNELALVQIQSIGHQLPSYIIFIELSQLPGQESEMYVYVKKLFNLIFRPINKLYGWGNIHMELMSIKNLITWPISAELINIQPYYSIWYDRARILCRIQSSIDQSQDVNDVKCDRQVNVQAPCVCHPTSPYKLNEVWSLKNALFYASGLIIQKECTMSHWAQSLTSSNSFLSYSTQQKMIEYAKEDVMVVTFLIRPILEQWSFIMIQQRRINEAFMAFEPKKLPPLPQPNKKKKKKKNIDLGTFSRLLNGKNVDPGSSDEEIYLCQLIEPTDSNDNDVKINDSDVDPSTTERSTVTLTESLQHDLMDIPADEEKQDEADELLLGDDEPLEYDKPLEQDEPLQSEDINEEEERVPTEKRKRKRNERSAQARHRENKKRNRKMKKKRYYYYITRKWYPRFPMVYIRKILHLYGIQFTHVNDEGDILKIGLKDRSSRHAAQRLLPSNIFNGRSYFYYRNLFRR
jgi:hypothetical protein